MKIIHVEAKYSKKVELPIELIDSLPHKIILFTTIQYIHQLEEIIFQLGNKEVIVIKPRHACHKGQILGCSNEKITEDGDILYIGDGLFHPKAILLKNNKKIHVYNPKSKKITVLTQKDVEKIQKRLKGNYIKFLSSNNIGVLITTKFGQYKEKLAEKLEKDFPDKKFYFFLDNTYDFQSLENFPYIDMFLNTMCERLGYDDSEVQNISILNVEDVYEQMNNL